MKKVLLIVYEKRGKTCFKSTPLRFSNTLRLLRSYAAITRSRSSYISFVFDVFLTDDGDDDDLVYGEWLLIWDALIDIAFAEAKPSRANRFALPSPLPPALLSISKRESDVLDDLPLMLLVFILKLAFCCCCCCCCYSLRANVVTALCSLGTRSNTGGAYTRYP